MIHSTDPFGAGQGTPRLASNLTADFGGGCQAEGPVRVLDEPMFERARAAAAKAKEHLEVAELLGDRGFFAQAYAHVSLALEESSVAGIRFLTESGVISWDDPPNWFRMEEKDLHRPGTHRMKLTIGLISAKVRPVLLSASLPESPDDVQAVLRAIRDRGEELRDAIHSIFEDEVLSQFIREGQHRKEAAFYSTPKSINGPLPVSPTEHEYRRLVEVARPLVLSLEQSLPDPEDLAKVRPLFSALFHGDPAAATTELESLFKGMFIRSPDRSMGSGP